MPSGERTDIVRMEPPECWAALRTVDLGRLSFSIEGLPEIFPINYLVDQGSVVFRTGARSKIAMACDGRPVAFEADGRTDGKAWSVVAKGEAHEIRGLYDSLAVAELPLHPQQAGHKDRLARLTPSEVTGRRFAVVDPSSWDTALTSAPRSAPE
jgi:hypothetical protein